MPGNSQQQTIAQYIDDTSFTIEGESEAVGKWLRLSNVLGWPHDLTLP